MWQICAGLYLILVIPIAAILWTALVAAKRHDTQYAGHYADVVDEAPKNPPGGDKIHFRNPVHSVDV